MKTTDMEEAIQFHFDLLNYGVTPLSYGSWKHRDLKSRFWRIYRHDRYGAGIIHNGKTIEFFPDFFYLVPPQIKFSCWSKADIQQFSANFIIQPIRGDRIYQIKADEELENIYAALNVANDAKRNVLLDKINLVALCTGCLRRLPDELFGTSDSDDIILQHVCGEINDFYLDKDPLKNIAATQGLSSSTMNRIFHEKLAMSPYQYLLKQRYAYAAKLLVSTELSLKEICSIINVNDVYHFSRTFKRRYGKAPSLYRQEHAGEKNQ